MCQRWFLGAGFMSMAESLDIQQWGWGFPDEREIEGMEVNVKDQNDLKNDLEKYLF